MGERDTSPYPPIQPLSPLLQELSDRFDRSAGLRVTLDVFFHAFAGIEDCRVVFSMEIVTQRRVGLVQLIAAQVHGDLARDDDLLRTAAAEELILLDAVVLADGIDDEVDGKLLSVVEGDLVFQRILGEGERDRLFLDLREGDELIESPSSSRTLVLI